IKGKLIFISILIFLIATFLEIFIPITPFIILARFLVMIFAIIFYSGFILPKWAERLFFKEK
ncbi:MAG: hypothetical protein ACFFDN_37200, partial [Candidatus Hodarchaeota archaeon]